MRTVVFVLLSATLWLWLTQPADAACSDYLNATTVGACGSVGYEGCCSGNRIHWCELDSGELCEFDCSNNFAPDDTCGWKDLYEIYDCGGYGAEPYGLVPIDCPGSASGDCLGTATPSAYGCTGFSFVGCCDSLGRLLWCGNDGNTYCSDCASGNMACGWDYIKDFYNCSETSQRDPSGLNPYSCDGGTTPCEPSCLGRQCGDDGCGGSCGFCPTGQSCVNFACQSTTCTPSCNGKQCGDDGCGGPCGNCPAGQTCINFLCQTGTCSPNCSGRQCGDDGCNGSCGQCPAGQTCNEGLCLPQTICEPQCSGRRCGDDGCGGVCGNCDLGFDCVSGRCLPQACVPDCTGKQCGSNSCGGMCGACGIGWHCDPATSQCVEGECVASCAERQCGDDGCGGSCGSCDSSQECNAYGLCADPAVVPCQPDCGVRACGDDGCGGSCGTCENGLACTSNGLCVGEENPQPDAVEPAADLATVPGSCSMGYTLRYGICIPLAAPDTTTPAQTNPWLPTAPSRPASASDGCRLGAVLCPPSLTWLMLFGWCWRHHRKKTRPS